MSPYYFNNGSAAVFCINSAGTINSAGVNNPWDVRPVINLSANAKLSGDGTHTNPYVVQET